MPKHVHCDLIKAWADGEQIQWFALEFKEWMDFGTFENFNPGWNPKLQYRIKPKTKVIKYRNYLWKSSVSNRVNILVVTDLDNKLDLRETWSGFIGWIGDWQEVEVEDV